MKRLLTDLALRYRGRIALLVLGLTTMSLLQGLGTALLAPLLTLAGVTGPGDAGRIGRISTVVRDGLALVGARISLETVLMLFVALVIVESGVRYLTGNYVRRIVGMFVFDLRVRLFGAYLAAPWSYWQGRRSGAMTSLLTTETQRVSVAFRDLTVFLSESIVALGLLLVAVGISWQLTAFFGVGAAALLLVMRRYVQEGRQTGGVLTTENNALHDAIQEQLHAAKLVKASAMEAWSLARFSGAAGRVNVAETRLVIAANRTLELFNPLIVGLLCAGLYVSIVYLRMNPAELLVVLLIFFRIAVKVSLAQKMWHGVLLNAPGYQAIVDEIGVAERVRLTHPAIGRGVRRPRWNHVVLDHVGYEYAAGSPVLSDVSLAVPANKTVALVGGSGSGKSTIVDLILGLLLPTHGMVRVDDVDLRDIDLAAWRGQIGYVAQESVLFNDSVRNNIRWGRPEATDDEIRAVARLAQADEFITAMRDGYATVVGDRGSRLSGGQRQRIALAAALIRKPRLLILDEATSNLDAASEQALRHAIDTLKGEMTMLIVAHRLATVASADWIYVIERGTIVQQGTCDELRHRRGRFQDLWALQQHTAVSVEGVAQTTGEQR